MLSWGNLHEQFGTEYADQKDFKRRFLATQKKVRGVYKEARIDQVRGGVRIYDFADPTQDGRCGGAAGAGFQERPEGCSGCVAARV